MTRLVCRIGFFVVAACSATFASKPCQALNGGYTVEVTRYGRIAVFNAAYGTYATDLFTAKLYNGTNEVPALQECGKDINWEWSKAFVAHKDQNGNVVFDSTSVMGLAAGNPRNTAYVTVPSASTAHYGYEWGAKFIATASQGPTDCHPQGWDQSGEGNMTYVDSPPLPPPPGAIIASVPPLV